MTQGLTEGQRTLQQARGEGVNQLDRVAIGLLESEMIALDMQPGKARQVFEEQVEPLLSELDQRVAASIVDNKSTLQMALLENVGNYYHLVDSRRILGVNLRDHASTHEAASLAAAGKHYDALPMYWQQLRSSYELQNWQARRVAEADFCNECIQLGWLDEAAFHAILAGKESTTERCADALLSSRDSDRIAAALEKLLGASGLREHARQTIQIIVKCADAIPERLIGQVTSLLNKYASFEPTGWHDVSLFVKTWDAIRDIAHRLDNAAIRRLINVALSHPVLKRDMVARVHLIDALNALTSCTHDADDLKRVANVALSLVTDRRSDTDYRSSLNLVCHAADRGCDEVRLQIRSTLFPPGMEVRDTLLMQVGPTLGWKPQKPETFSEGAIRTADAVRRQVQRLGPDEEPVNIGGYGTISNVGPGGRVVVQMQGAQHIVQALAANRALIDGDALRVLIDAMLDMMSETDNTISNRAGLTLAIEEFLDCFPSQLEQRAVEVLKPMAEGSISEPSHGQSHAEATSPLNRFKIGFGDPVDLRGLALRCLCKLDSRRPGVCPALHNTLLLTALTNVNPTVRRYALLAASHNTNLTSIEKSTISIACLDPDPQVSTLALHAMIESDGVENLEPLTWQIIIRSIECGASSAHGPYRERASKMLKILPAPPAELKERLELAKDVLLNDVLYSVRKWLR